MIRLIPIALSLMVASTGAFALSHAHSGNEALNANVQNADTNIQDSSDLFLSANGHSNIHIDIEVQEKAQTAAQI